MSFFPSNKTNEGGREKKRGKGGIGRGTLGSAVSPPLQQSQVVLLVVDGQHRPHFLSSSPPPPAAVSLELLEVRLLEGEGEEGMT